MVVSSSSDEFNELIMDDVCAEFPMISVEFRLSCLINHAGIDMIEAIARRPYMVLVADISGLGVSSGRGGN